MQKQQTRLDALEIFTAFLDLVLGIFFVLTFVQNMRNLQPGTGWDDRFLTVVVAIIALSFGVGGAATLLSVRRLAGGAHLFVALGLIGLSAFIGYSLLSGWGNFSGVPWTGIMVTLGLVGFSGLFCWFARRALKSL